MIPAWAALLALSLSVCATADAARVSAVSPSGEVAEVRQVTLRFSDDVVPAGNPRLPAPFALRCNGAAPPGDGRWLNGREWVFDLREALSAGTPCVLRAEPGFRPMAGALEGATEFRFSTGAPAIVQTQPYRGSQVDEDQHFLLRLNGEIDLATLAGHAWCEVEGIGERIGLRLVQGAPREALLRERRITRDAARWLLVACERPLPALAGVRIVWGPGIASAQQPGLVTTAPRSIAWKVRPRLLAEFSCERERAHAPCMPLRPLLLRFSAPVPRTMALAARLVPEQGPPLAPIADTQQRSDMLTEVRFAAPLPENMRFRLTLPAELRDEAGRTLANAGAFPLPVASGGMPPLAKFAAAPLGIVEAGPEAMMPLTLRHVQADLAGASTTGVVRTRRLDPAIDDAELLRWIARLDRHHEGEISAKEAGLPQHRWTVLETETDARGRPRVVQRERRIATRELSLLKDDALARRADLPVLQGAQPRATEVIGIPLPQPGVHVLEVESQLLGHALLATQAPMFVRTAALVTRLGVHFKRGRSSSLVWVTTLERGRPVAGARVAVADCAGRPLWSGRTDAQGIAHIDRGFEDDPEDAERCLTSQGLFVTARHADTAGRADLSFVFSRWNRGIEAWRFNLPLAHAATPDRIAHTVFDRALLRAGEVLSMKHFVRDETARGLALPAPDSLPDAVVLTHVGSGSEVVLPLAWRAGARSAESRWQIPRTARLGAWDVALRRGDQRLPSGSLRIEEFRVPLVDARLAAPKGVLVAPQQLALQAQINLFAGGPLPQVPARLSALLRERLPTFAGFDEFQFAPPRRTRPADEEAGEDAARLVADRLDATTDAQGAAQVSITALPALQAPSELVAELSFPDPNGETQTVTQRLRLWPSAVVVGVRARDWAAVRGALRFDAVVLDTSGRPLAGREIEVRARQHQWLTTRKRIVGGFYAYDQQTLTQEQGVLCSGRSDAQGRLACDARMAASGEIELIASARDDGGRLSQAAASVWVSGDDEQSFAQDNDDRIDVLPEKRELAPGETARLQVRMPFREATALVSVEREGVIDSRVVTLRGREPVIELPIPPATDGAKSWAPNVMVSMLVLRGRVREVPWSSFFRWGWREPLEWWRAFRYEGRDWRAPTAMVDLAKPAFRLGVAELRIGLAAHRLEVQVRPERSSYGVRETVRTTVTVTRGGKPVAGADVAFAAVDEGLLALRDNSSWQLLEALLRRRPWGVETATAQGEIVGRRHYGRKALPAGGDGGANPTRELFDTLLLWRGSVTLDAKGQAVVEVPLNDALTSFRLVALADAGADLFGTGSASVRVTQDLQLFSGLPPLVREGDRFDATLTLRNSTTRAMTVRARLGGQIERAAGAAPAAQAASTLTLPEQSVALAAGAARELRWAVAVPAGAQRIEWTATAEDSSGGRSRDQLKAVQTVAPLVPLRVQQASLQALDGRLALSLAAPADALPAADAAGGAKAGGVQLTLQRRLSGELPGLRRFFETYPYTCLEQKVSRTIALRETERWNALRDELPGYLDADGLAAYFPPRPQDAPRGSDRLTAYLVATAHEAGLEWPAAVRESMLQGLAAFVEGRLMREMAGARQDLDVRKLAALEALSRYGRVQPRQLGSLAITPATWPTSALLDWWSLLRRVSGLPDREVRLAEVQALLRSRLALGGTQLRFSTEDSDGWWWLMESADGNAARLLLAAVDAPQWQADVPRLVAGHLARQRRGAWATTTANLWSMLALERFAARFESTPVGGRTTLRWDASGPAAAVPRNIDWDSVHEAQAQFLPWPAAPRATLQLVHEGAGRPWVALQALAAVPLLQPMAAGYRVQRSSSAVQRAAPEGWSRGDIVRVRLEVEAAADMAWVVVQDPLPPGAVLLGSGLGRDSMLAARGERREGSGWLAFEERAQEAWRAYYEWLPRGRHVVEYTMRLNSAGRFTLPPVRVEAMYAPESFGEHPGETIEVRP